MPHASTIILISCLECWGEKTQLPRAHWSLLCKFLDITVIDGVIELMIGHKIITATTSITWDVRHNRVAQLNKLLVTLFIIVLISNKMTLINITPNEQTDHYNNLIYG